MKKLSFISVLTMLLCMVNVKAYAYDLEVKNSDGVTIYYNYINDKKELEVTRLNIGIYSGDIKIPEYVYVSRDQLTYPVTSIGDYAFQGCSDLTSVTIPNSVTSIGEITFAGCSGLTELIIPNSVTSIGSNAFSGCSGLTELIIPNSVTSIGNGAFRGCSSLVSVVVDAGNNVYDSRNNCNAIIETSTNTIICGSKGTIIPNSVTSIGDYAFERCSGLTELTIPNSVTSIGSAAFYGCSGLTELIIPNSVTSIGNDAFGRCSGLTELTISNSVTSIGDNAFWYCIGLTELIIPNSVTSIGYGAFSDCRGLTELTIPNSVTSIGDFAFSFCSGLTELTIPNSVTYIGHCVFQHCSGLTELTIPNSVTSIGHGAFQGCSSLTSVTSLIEEPFAISTSDDIFYRNTKATLYVPAGTKEKYLQTAGWSYYFANIEEVEIDKDYDKITLTDARFATYCSEYDLDFTGVEGLKAYIASGFYPETGKVLLTNVTTVPAGTGIILMGGEGTYEVPHASTQFYCVNMLKGTLTEVVVPENTEDGYTNYVLAKGENGVVAFYRSNDNKISAHKAYLQIPSISLPNASRVLGYMIDDDMSTGIGQLQQETQQDDAIYNLNGQRVEQPRKGLYIQNGKKIFIR